MATERHSETRRLRWALVISALYFVAELIAGFMTNSLALLSDAGHMLSDIGAMALSMFAFRFARRPANEISTYGFHRVEILAALFNGLTLWLIVGVILNAAYHRIIDPPVVQSFGMVVVAVLGLAVNIAAGAILYERHDHSHGHHHHHNLNLHGAFLHVVSDAIGSIGAILAGVVMMVTDWYWADPLISVVIGVLILGSSWNLVKESVSILMQSVPKGLRLDEVQKALESVDGVEKLHDLHIWAVTSGIATLSAHAVVHNGEDFDAVLTRIEERLKQQFGIEHTTIQLETQNREEQEFKDF